MVALSESGHLEVCYLGTDPAIFVPPMVESRDLNYAAMDAEMARLTKHVKSKSANNGECLKSVLPLCCKSKAEYSNRK